MLEGGLFLAPLLAEGVRQFFLFLPHSLLLLLLHGPRETAVVRAESRAPKLLCSSPHSLGSDTHLLQEQTASLSLRARWRQQRTQELGTHNSTARAKERTNCGQHCHLSDQLAYRCCTHLVVGRETGREPSPPGAEADDGRQDRR